MNIEKINPMKETKTNTSFLSEISSQIFAVCKEDPNFDNQFKLNSIEIQLKKIKIKIIKQDDLLNKSKKIEEGFNKRFQILENKLDVKREKLLESLGSEL